MNKKAILTILFIGLFFIPSFSFAQTINNPLNSNDFSELLDKILTGISGFIASLSIIMLIIAGIFYLTSAGDPSKVKIAKDALTYAIIGLAIALAAEGITEIIKDVLGVT